MMNEGQRELTAPPYQFFMLVLCGYALGAMAIEALLPLESELRDLLRLADFGVCLIFMADFAWSLWRAPNRYQYFFRWGWIDLLSSVPQVGLLRLGRAARVLRIVRVLRGVRATKIVAEFILERRAESAFMAAALVSLLLMVFASAAILEFEPHADGSNIKDAADAIWWAFVTITTVGYGDRFPVTSEGRMIGALLMTAGVGLFGTFSGFVAAWFLSPATQRQEVELEQVLEEVRALRREIERLRPEGD